MKVVWIRFLGFLTGVFIGFTLLTTTLSPQILSHKQKQTSFPETTTTTSSITLSVKNGKKEQSVFCWVPILNHTEARYIKTTWGSYCDKLVFMSKLSNGVDILGHGYERLSHIDLWNQVLISWAKIAELFLNEYDWFIKLDADSFFCADNLRLLTKDWNSDSLAYFGHTLHAQGHRNDDIDGEFNIGGGYGISRGLLRNLAPYFPDYPYSTIPDHLKCSRKIRWAEDYYFSSCLRKAFPKFAINDSRDTWGRERFQPLTPRYLMKWNKDLSDWYWKGKTHARDLLGCCSSRPILFHYLKNKDWWYMLEYVLFQMSVDPIEHVTS